MSTETISTEGNVWNLHRASEEEIPLVVTEADGSPTDISGDYVVFRVKDGPEIVLETDARYPTGLILKFTFVALEAIPARGSDFYIKNLTTGEVYLDGRVFVRGFA